MDHTIETIEEVEPGLWEAVCVCGLYRMGSSRELVQLMLEDHRIYVEQFGERP